MLFCLQPLKKYFLFGVDLFSPSSERRAELFLGILIGLRKSVNIIVCLLVFCTHITYAWLRLDAVCTQCASSPQLWLLWLMELW